eukprot:scpid109791/ scgid13874/ 
MQSHPMGFFQAYLGCYNHQFTLVSTPLPIIYFWSTQGCSSSCSGWSLMTGASASGGVSARSELDLQRLDQSYSFQLEQELRRHTNALQISFKGSVGQSLASLDVAETLQKSLRVNHVWNAEAII